MIYPVGKDISDYRLNWYIAQEYGRKTSYGYHEGVDFNLRSGGDSDLGQPLQAIADGDITSVHDHLTGFGKHIHIHHIGEWGEVYSHYAHCDTIFCKVGDRVREGQKIATLGKTGTAYAHLHFAIKNQPTGIDSIPKSLEDLKKWEDPIAFIEKWSNMSQSPELTACLAAHKQLVDETVELKKQIESLKSEKQAFMVDVDNLKTSHQIEVDKLNVELQKLMQLETQLQRERDDRREDQLKWDMRRLDLEGEIEKLKQQLTTEDLSLRDYRDLLKALIRKVARYIQSVK